MIEKHGNIFNEVGQCDALCITTNGALRKNGNGICGAGIAKQARDKWGFIEKRLGKSIKKHGNKVMPLLIDNNTTIVAFPTKEHWKDNSNIDLISESCSCLYELTNALNWSRVCLPRPGCMNGNLSWYLVKPILSNILTDDRFEIYYV
ncbi:MAG: hypothetical protein BAJALOKI3v1_50101 [Promethearchaeota archaeon]|nr:MAG: hypothetical protein BAJALOKI3v1_50101 [Candidatus Lokiarchaeota archaeon]